MNTREEVNEALQKGLLAFVETVVNELDLTYKEENLKLKKYISKAEDTLYSAHKEEDRDKSAAILSKYFE